MAWGRSYQRPVGFSGTCLLRCCGRGFPAGPMCDLKKGKFTMCPLWVNEGYTAKVTQAPSLTVLLHDGGVLLLLGCPFPSHSESPRHALLCGGSLCPHECCRCRGRDDVLPTPMRREFAQAMCMWWTKWEQAGWPFPGGSSLRTERLKRVSRISTSHSEMVP